MVTTENEYAQKPTAGTRAGGITTDAKDLKAEYVAGTSIAVLAEKYGYTEKEVEAAVVKEAKE